MFKPEIMIQIKLKRWWDQLGYLTIESGLPGFFSFSFLSFSCLSSAQSGSHLTHIRTTHSPLHTHTPVGQLQSQCQNIIHMAILNPPPPHRLFSSCSLSLSLPFSFTTSRLVKVAHAHSHGHSHKPLTPARTHWLLCMHRQTVRWEGLILQDAGEKRGRVGKERARVEGGEIEGGEKA